MPPLTSLMSDATFTVEVKDDILDLHPDVHGETLRAATVDGSIWVEFTVAECERYTTLTIRDWQGIADRPGASLRVTVSEESRLYLTELDYMGSYSERDSVRRISWLSPSKHFGGNPPGAFAVFEADNDEAHDEALLHIWVNESQPHPNTGQEWTLDYARQWLEDWQATFGKRSQMVVNAESLQELYDLVPYAEKAAIDEIYIFTNTWRPDPFWPMTDVNWALNPKVFPNGRTDLRAYSDHLAERGIRLALHYVSGGMGLHDPVYVTPLPHPDLAAWGVGMLPKGIDETPGAFSVRPAPDMTWPLHERGHFSDTVLQVGDELIVPGNTVVEADGTWSLTDCERGAYDTAAGVHQQGCDVKFLVVPYGQNFVPDNNSDLLYEVADNFASLLNECRLTHAEFDGAEIHCYDGNYGYIKFAQRIYEKMDHAISGHDSSASAPHCFFEYRFKSTQRALRGKCGFTHGNWLVPFQVDSASRPASTVLDANFFLSQGHWGGAMGMSKPEPMFGITSDMLATHGLTDRFLETLHDWKVACRQLTDDQHRVIEESLSDADWPMPEASRHRVADAVYTVRRRENANRDGRRSRPTENMRGNVGRERFPASEEVGYELVPVRVMTRQAGDIKWQLGQEYGPLSPRQFVRPGEPLELVNPFAKQPPEFVLRVLPGFNQGAASVPASALSSDAEAVFDDKDFFVEGNEPGPRHRGALEENIELWTDAFDRTLQASNDSAEAAYHVRDLPVYPLRVDLSAHRGLGVELEGDGSGALVLVQLEGHGCRDYVIPIDFEGTRYVEIPCGEVAWARADWGWRMGTKTMNYAAVAQCRIGLGMVPAQSTVSVRIRRLTALAEKPVALTNPCIRINESRLQIEGNIETGNYLVYAGGDTVDVYDPNWHQVEQLAISCNDLQARPGANRVMIATSVQGTPLWLECQFLVNDAPLVPPRDDD